MTIMQTTCMHHECPWKLLYSNGVWYHVDTHGAEVDHDPEPLLYG